jgi:inner membrane protein
MSEQPPSYTPRRHYFNGIFQSLGFRTAVIAALVLLMLIPLFMVEKVVGERQTYHQQVLQDVAQTWGGKQTLVGPVMVVPYTEHFTSVETVADKDGESRIVSKDIFNDRTAILLPENLEIRADLKEEHRQRGIYDALVYTANLSLTGKFDHSVLLKGSAEGDRRLLWEKAFIMIGVSDTKAIGTVSGLMLGDERISLEPGTQMPDLLPLGFHAPLASNDNTATNHEFKLTMSLRGSDSLSFAPLGKTTKARITSSWTHPSFQGELLPTKREINAQGFNAEWEIPHLVRSYPQHWVVEDKQAHKLDTFTAGVSLYEPVSLYSQVVRAVKYAVLFIGLTFLLFFGFEIHLKQRLHVLQYVLVGVSLALFYLILLALAEHIGFLYAYIAAASTTVMSITLYTKAILRNTWRTLGIFTLLAGLYGALYLLLQMEDYALLVGVGLLLLATGMMMYITRHLQQTP